jgi:hypothetical protein
VTFPNEAVALRREREKSTGPATYPALTCFGLAFPYINFYITVPLPLPVISPSLVYVFGPDPSV